MTVQSVTCPLEPMLTDFSLGKLDAAQAEAISQHLEACAECRQRAAGVTGDSFVERLKQAGSPPSVRRERTYVPGESLSNAANSTDGSSAREDGLPRPSRTVDDEGKHDGPGRPPHVVSAPPELANHPDYELIKELGQGGMGTVYLAKNRMMDRLEVLKVISKELLARPGALERFQQEIRSAARLAHPNIVAAYSVLRPGELLVFAMEYVKGQDLSQVIKGRGALPVANAAFYIHQVANGLQHAFEKGMVHRDIKPNNLMLAIDGKKHVVKVLDFGLAKATSEKGAETGLTKSGQMLGTPDYVAPEQTLDAHKADIRADIYSLGCTLYFLLSGGPPFQETSLYEILEAHHKREPKPLNLVRPDVPIELATVVATMMAKDPAKRYQTPIEVAKALAPFFKSGQAVSKVNATDTSRTPPPGETPHGLGAPTPVAPITPPPTPIPAAVAVASPMPDATAEPADLLRVSMDTYRPAANRRTAWWRPSPPRQRWTALVGAAAVMLLGTVFLIRTPKGTIKLELSDSNADVEVTVDGNRVDIAGLDEPLSLEVGEHSFKVVGKGFETITDQFKVIRGKNAPLEIKLARKDTAEPTPPAPGAAPAEIKAAPAGWVQLFNGKDTNGWEGNPNWKVENGILNGFGHLRTQRSDFKDFHLRIEARIATGGYAWLVVRDRSGQWNDGYAIVLNNDNPNPSKTGTLIVPDRGPVRNVTYSPIAAGQWFTLEVIAQDDRLVVKVAGQTTAVYSDPDRRFAAGCIWLGPVGRPGEVVHFLLEFRKIEIKEFPESDAGEEKLQEFIQNPTFAEEFSGWNLEGGAPGFHVFPTKHGHNALTTFGIYKDQTMGRIYQQFRVPQNAKELEFDVHGRNLPNLYVALKQGEKRHFKVTGHNSNEWRHVTWNLQELRGKPVTLEIVDHAPDGYIGVKNFRIVVDGPSGTAAKPASVSLGVLVHRELEFQAVGLAHAEAHPAKNFVASCHEGLSLWRQNRSGKGAGRRSASPSAPVSAPGAALGSHLCVALSSVQVV